MSKKLKRSAVALVLAATMVFSSQGVLTAFAVGENETSTAVDVSALEPILDKEETDVANESGNVNDDPLENVCEICGGADGQHTEDCTVNQQPENTCPVCGGVDGQHEEGCSANQQPENTCPVCGGVDGQHEEGCSANQQPDEGDSGETACPECGGVDGQHEENCSLAQKPDNTPSEEDVAAVQAVVDVINSLPTTDALANYTPTIELKPEDEGYQEAYQAALDAYYSQVQEQVKAARAAYDALTEEQKAAFDATVLAKLTALEELIAMREQADVLPNEDTVAMIGSDEYSSLNSAITAAPNNGIITLVKDCSLTSVQNLNGRSITIDGGSEKHHIDANGTHINVNGNLTFQNVSMDVYNTPQGHWMYFYLSQGSSLEFVNSTVTVDGSNAPDNCTVMYYPEPYQEAAHFTLDNSSFIASNCDGNGISWGGRAKDGFNTITVINGSTLDISHCAAKNASGGGGIIGTFEVTVTDSTLKSHDNSSYGSNGSHFYFTNATVDFSNNETHGLSAGNLIIENSDIVTNDNGMFGITYTGEMSMDGTSTIDCERNALENSGGGIRADNAGNTSTVDAGAIVDIKDNGHNGLENYGDFTFEEGAIVTITGNDERTTNGGGIFNDGTLNLSSKTIIMNNHAFQTGGGICNAGTVTIPAGVQLYNNHAGDAGDDIYNRENAIITFTEVGSNWVLDDCNHAITGWFDDSKDNRWNVHTGPVHAELYDEFDETTGLATVTGLKALKAAHPYQYDPEAPTEPSEPVDWETSKSKTATNLDANYESQVTLSLPAKDEQLVSDVVFVLDKSTSTNVTDEIKDMLDSLAARIAETDGAAVNVGVVSFNQTASIELPLTRLTADNLEEIKTSMDSLEQISGTNMNAGLLAGKEMLDNHTDVDASRKYMIIVSDGISYYYCKGTDYKTAYTIASLNGGDDGNGNKNCQPNSGASCFEIKYGATNIPNWSDWYADMPGLLSSEYSTYEYNVDDPNLPSTTDLDSKGAIPYADRQNYPINVDISLYSSYNLYQEMLAEGYHCYSVFGREDTGVPYAFGPAFMEYMGGDTYLGESGTTAFETIENDIFYLLDAGSSVIDVIGGDDNGEQYDYDFDFVNDLSKITLTVNGVEKEGVPLGENHYGFGEKINYEGQEVYEYELTYYPNGLGVATMAFENEDVVAGELFVWDIYVPVKQFEPVQLTYTVKLANPKTADGTYGQYDADGSENYAGLYTNNSAVLFPVDSNGNVGEKEAFDKPTVSYTVSNGKPVEPTPDPDPDPDRPSRPNRDDDDDWEPLPDAPVKDKPTTEVDVPEETETPTTEQPDKYNPETGDTTTVFAAMALAAVSLGGVVLLGRKKK